MLPMTASCPAAAFFESIDQIGPRTLPSRVKTHEQTSNKRKCDCENEHRQMQLHSAFKWNPFASDTRNNRYGPKRQPESDNPRDNTDQRALEHEQSNDVAALGSHCHA